jgi:hypothetical protein
MGRNSLIGSSLNIGIYTEIPYSRSIAHGCRNPAYLASADDEGLSASERSLIVDYLARRPNAGDIIPGTGGARKVRFAGRGKGKSGGYRGVTFYAGEDIPLFLLDVYGKTGQANLSKAERNELRKVLTALPREWRARMKLKGSKR